ncbi:hypothetical protein C8F04DRAFT_1264072 [Mycena alexandri]|uniref:Uncharacterized protein n=1 Tax=Mycena alexandri TaxID=1745969 RepID=A0AAD6X0H6_9AGAR|nr:hypothetical protein C8F04DRAFT_1264072 [Mycena alexandri]
MSQQTTTVGGVLTAKWDESLLTITIFGRPGNSRIASTHRFMTLTEDERKERRRRASRRHDFLNSTDRNEKTRLRMQRLRAGTSPEDRAARRRVSDENYRQRNKALLAANARAARQRAAESRLAKQAAKAADAVARRERKEACAVDRARRGELAARDDNSD